MAQLDISQALLNPLPQKPLSASSLGLTRQSGIDNIFNDRNGNAISENVTITPTLSKNQISFRYTGSFKSSGTEIYISNGYYLYWQITGVSFNVNDTFDFSITANLVCE